MSLADGNLLIRIDDTGRNDGEGGGPGARRLARREGEAGSVTEGEGGRPVVGDGALAFLGEVALPVVGDAVLCEVGLSVFVYCWAVRGSGVVGDWTVTSGTSIVRR